MFTQLTALMEKPELYEKGTADYTEIWTDEHISKGMLDAHLDPVWDAATRNHAFVHDAAKWIGTVAPSDKYPRLLDLGCGPGIYAELLHGQGYIVTGMDISGRSLDYARNSAKDKGLPIEYLLQDYSTLDIQAQYDIITLIYFDFGVFPSEKRSILLHRIHAALKPGGLLIFDVNTPAYLANSKESKSWSYEREGAFFCSRSHLLLTSTYLYEEKHTKCDRYFIITERGVKSINCWEHTFTKDEIILDLCKAGFHAKGIYGNIAGATYNEEGKELCIVAEK